MKQVKMIRILAVTSMLLLLAACGEEAQSASSLPDLGPWVITKESPMPSSEPSPSESPAVEITKAPAPTEFVNTGAETTMKPEQSGQPAQPQQPEQTPVVSASVETEVSPTVEPTDIDRSWLEGKIYGIADTAGVSDEVKQKIVEFILTSDWFWDTCVDVPYQTEWCFENGAHGITLLVKVWNTDVQLDGDNWCDFQVNTLYLNGNTVMDGLRSQAVELGTDLSTL